jgi:hypothetical protein
LLYNSHDPKHNNAEALKEYLESKLAATAQPILPVPVRSDISRSAQGNGDGTSKL